MSEKMVKFQENSLVQQVENDADEGLLKKGKHTLDSDEDDDDKYDVMKEDDIEGQEEKTIEFDDDIQITPFNMHEELEEGHFDKDGTFIFDKSKNLIKDNWIDNIDWIHVKESERVKAQERAAAAATEEDDLPPVDKKPLFLEMLTILQPQETVAEALRRLGKSKGKPLTSAQRWKAKRQKTDKKQTDSGDAEKAEQDQKIMFRLTEAADTLVQDGMMDVYDATREKISFMLKEIDDYKKTVSGLSINDDDALDMFADNFDRKEAEKLAGSSSEDGIKSRTAVTTVAAGQTLLERWEYKFENTESAEVLGPYTTLEMVNLKKCGHFKTGVYCRKDTMILALTYSELHHVVICPYSA